jgi:xylono-1,5-lactonase
MQVTCLSGRGAILGEGPLWDAARGCLWWIDIEGRALHRHDPATGRNSQRAMPGRPGFVTLHTSGHLVLGIEREVVLFDPDTEQGNQLAEVGGAEIRINDGACDHTGRLWFGTMDDKVTRPSGALYRLGPAGPEAAIPNVIASNGPAFGTDRRSLYHCDTLGRRILRYTLRPDGTLGSGSVFRSFTPEEGLPDGMACDTDGGLWVGLWGGGSVVRLGRSGAISDWVPVPAAQVSACAFGGPDLDTLFITTAAMGLSTDELAAAPDSGGLFMCRPGYRGQAPTPMQDALPILGRTTKT